MRRIIQFEPDAKFCLNPNFVLGVQQLSEFDMNFDLCIKGDEQFRHTLNLVSQCPEVLCILGHIGKPFIKEKIIEPWATYLKELSGMPDTWCKISGLVNEANWENWTPDDLQPYINHMIESFGFDRIMFGGDWPVCTLATTYQCWIETLWKAVSGCSTEQVQKLFSANAEKFYRV
ncbi:TPA: hypothetical protein EYN65_09970 [Candidatus Poribacteria bacterium]|nr:hypothetical protein [Candidatus Poribacteria bacterium]HIB86566.1 hypothetical protein [Candidatus Poribacteria bacterium]HIO09847.1 hypothetical protein [Candidatus Poribacteria bacterium]